MFKTMVGKTFLGTVMSAALVGGGVVAYKISENRLSGYNTLQPANSNAAETLDNFLTGTWYEIGNAKSKVVFTADTMTVAVGNSVDVFKYDLLCGGQVIVITEGNLANHLFKISIKDGELTLQSGTGGRKYKPADRFDKKTQTVEEDYQPTKNELTGTWKSKADQEIEFTFTADKLTAQPGGREGGYKYLCEQVVETKDGDNSFLLAKAVIKGDDLTWTAKGKVQQFTRAATASTANTAAPKEEVPLTQEEKAFENNLLGTWVNGDEKRVFTKDNFVSYFKGKLLTQVPYRILDKETIEMLGTSFTKDRIKITFADNNSTLDWRWADGNGFKAKRESNKTDVIVGDSLYEKIAGFWVGIAGTNSDKEKISIFHYGSDPSWFLIVNDTNPINSNFAVQDNKTVVFRDGSRKNVSVDGNVMTVEADGVTKKYNRQTTVD